RQATCTAAGRLGCGLDDLPGLLSDRAAARLCAGTLAGQPPEYLSTDARLSGSPGDRLVIQPRRRSGAAPGSAAPGDQRVSAAGAHDRHPFSGLVGQRSVAASLV